MPDQPGHVPVAWVHWESNACCASHGSSGHAYVSLPGCTTRDHCCRIPCSSKDSVCRVSINLNEYSTSGGGGLSLALPNSVAVHSTVLLGQYACVHSFKLGRVLPNCQPWLPYLMLPNVITHYIITHACTPGTPGAHLCPKSPNPLYNYPRQCTSSCRLERPPR